MNCSPALCQHREAIGAARGRTRSRARSSSCSTAQSSYVTGSIPGGQGLPRRGHDGDRGVGAEQTLLLLTPTSYFRRASAVRSLKYAIEVRKITKSRSKRDRRDAAVREPPIEQHSMCPNEAAAQNKLRERCSLRLEQLANVAFRDSLAPCDSTRRQIAIRKMSFDIALDGSQPRRADATPLGDLDCLPRRSNCDRDEVA